MPCSPAKQRSGSQPCTTVPRPASAAAAVQGRASSSREGRGGSSGPGSPGEVRAVHGLTIPAEYSLPGSPQHPKPRKWLKFKSSSGREAGEAEQQAGGPGPTAEGGIGKTSSGGWGGIFAFRRSVDGASSSKQ